MPAFPTAVHEEAAADVVEFFSACEVEAVLLVNSCARGVATPESDLDMAVLVDAAVPPEQWHHLEAAWQQHYEAGPVFKRLEALGRFSRVHLDLFNGHWVPQQWDDGGGPDSFEIEIGNRVANALPLWQRASAFEDVRAHWLPYYDDALRQERLRMVVDACHLNLDRVRAAVGRKQYFHALDRLHHAFQEFLQAVFIARRVYPIAYNKWIREQVVDWLGLPDLYVALAPLLEVRRLESRELIGKAERLSELLSTWRCDGTP